MRTRLRYDNPSALLRLPHTKPLITTTSSLATHLPRLQAGEGRDEGRGRGRTIARSKRDVGTYTAIPPLAASMRRLSAECGKEQSMKSLSQRAAQVFPSQSTDSPLSPSADRRVERCRVARTLGE
jgi:hypothetical protein